MKNLTEKNKRLCTVGEMSSHEIINALAETEAELKNLSLLREIIINEVAEKAIRRIKNIQLGI